ncbi:hypothetical protein [Armatimonas sp.]|uniref:hypothetical protein n=1 Tax=Armatimonas sp. TaxID=1872638 RepID=UPI00286AB9BB|nr:hypothetical protein [Armatimonas sp.]
MSLRLAFYGASLTELLCGLERFAQAGVKTRLYLSSPTSLPADLEVLGFLSESPAALQPLHIPIHHALATPESLGAVLELGARALGSQAIPLIFAAPREGHFVAFRGLHRQLYPESPWAIARQETDLAVLLHQQTEHFSLYDMSCLYLEAGREAVRARLKEIQSDPEPSVIFFDSLTTAHEALVGEILWEQKPRLVVGAEGVQTALLAAWETAQLLPEVVMLTRPEPLSQLLVAHASALPESRVQQDWARASGFFCHTFRDAPRAVKVAQGALSVGHSVALFAEDPALGPELAHTVIALHQKNPQRRLVLSSSVALAPELGIEALEWVAALAPGCPLCRIVGGPLENGEVVVQAETLGPEQFFLKVRQGIAV